ncbi:MAG TPA: LLM class F420-dependent oxidoreductase [Geminicoccaceae bacterium]|jgi:probable F420-dependent oxidoreductase|nr:LLM class F420-dependent oxidoreductase [Geminicoccaceae bacterium]
MKIGFYFFATDYSMPVVEAAKALEERGFESLFLPEHTHIPASRRSPWPGGAELPREYSHTLDPFVGLAAAAAATEKLRLGTGVCLLTEHDPIVTAKAVATLDLVSGGRFEFGIGAGWNAEEMENHGTAFETRFRVMVDRAKAMQAIWTNEEAAYQGEFTAFEPIWSWPKPVQKPHPPILLGGETKYSLRRVMEFCDGWIPRGRSFADPQAEMSRLRSFAEEAGRDIKTVSVTLFAAKPDAAYLEQCRAAGVDRALLALPPEGRDTVLPVLDRYVAFLA